MGFNVTKAADFTTVETWMAECPKGVNFQIIVEAESTPPPNLGQALSTALGVAPLKYFEKEVAEG
jgi:hypothetical protein